MTPGTTGLVRGKRFMCRKPKKIVGKKEGLGKGRVVKDRDKSAVSPNWGGEGRVQLAWKMNKSVSQLPKSGGGETQKPPWKYGHRSPSSKGEVFNGRGVVWGRPKPMTPRGAKGYLTGKGGKKKKERKLAPRLWGQKKKRGLGKTKGVGKGKVCWAGSLREKQGRQTLGVNVKAGQSINVKNRLWWYYGRESKPRVDLGFGSAWKQPRRMGGGARPWKNLHSKPYTRGGKNGERGRSGPPGCPTPKEFKRGYENKTLNVPLVFPSQTLFTQWLTVK